MRAAVELVEGVVSVALEECTNVSDDDDVVAGDVNGDGNKKGEY